MGYYQEVLINRANGWPDDPDDVISAADLAAYAARLKGEVDGIFIRCRSPGRRMADRSCHVRFDGKDDFHIYDCAGDASKAAAMVGKALGIAPKNSRKDYTPYILELRHGSLPAAGTLVETYLRSRGITVPVPASLAYHPSIWNKENQTRMPGMIAERCNVAGTVITVHRTFLRYDGHGKAPVRKPRLDLHDWRGTAIRLSPVADENGW